jgi:hypothetical protein
MMEQDAFCRIFVSLSEKRDLPANPMYNRLYPPE